MNAFISPNGCLGLAASMWLLASIASAPAQGTILFDTMEVGARTCDLQCEPLSGDGFVAQLYVLSEATGTFRPLGVPVPFGAGNAEGHVQGGTVVVPFLPPFSWASVKMRVWESRFASYEDAFGSMDAVLVVQTLPLTIALGAEDYPARLFGLEPLWGGCTTEVRLEQLLIHDQVIEIRWSQQALQSWLVVVPQEADTPLGPWRDIDGPRNPVNGIASPPKSFQVLKSAAVRFYRMRVTSNTSG